MTSFIYFDNSATTRISKSALDLYCRLSNEEFGNPSSLHRLGMEAEKHLSKVRNSLRRALGTSDGTVIFTGSGTEANNLAICGRAHAKARFSKGRILTTAGEHASVSMPLARLREEGFDIVEIPTTNGVIDLSALESALDKDCILVSMMLVNNETGALYDLQEVSSLVKRKAPNAVIHCDATQAFLKIPFSVRRLGVDMITVSAHKVEGPKGVGALWISDALVKNKGLCPLTLGGGQEGGFRAGTENVPAIAAFGQAVDDGLATLNERNEKLSLLSQKLLDMLDADAFCVISPLMPQKRAPHIVTLTLPHIKSEVMLHHLSSRGIFVSSGSACSSHGRHGAHPLIAFGLDERSADCSIRVSFSAHNTEEELSVFCDALKEGLDSLARMH